MSGSSPAFATDLTPASPRPLAGGRADAYARARRHSSRVRWLKVAIPLGATVAAGLVVAVTVYNPFGKIGGLTLGPVSLSGAKLAMESPRLTGFRKDAKPYEVTATAAFQDVRKPTVIELKSMKAKLVMDDAGNAAHLVAALGLFDTTKDQLELKDDIRITTDKGDEVLLKTAAVDFKGGTVTSRDPVKITTANGTVEAEGVHVSDNGHTFSFTGRVRTEFRHQVGDKPAAAGSAPPAAAAKGAGRPTRLSEAEGSRP